MQFKDGCRVFTMSGQDIGKVDRVVIDARTKGVTHIVVRKGVLLTEDKVIPITAVVSATSDRVVLNHNADNLDKFPPFEETHYVPVNSDANGVDYQSGYVRPLYTYPPIGMAWPLYTRSDFVKETERNIPDNAVAIKEGSEVISSDNKRVGTLDRMVTDVRSQVATHLVVSQGLLVKDKKVIPVSWIKHIGEHRIELEVEASLIESLKGGEAGVA